ncbi:MAG: hypothetical protein HQK77_14200 [Desulfobacterales bacterium]|nr:hypothetical protein [Desulfobacterales bacterium]
MLQIEQHLLSGGLGSLESVTTGTDLQQCPMTAQISPDEAIRLISSALNNATIGSDTPDVDILLFEIILR